MGYADFERICYMTEQREENVPLRNIRTGKIGYSLGCTYEGSTIQVRMIDGTLDSWGMDDCIVITPDKGRVFMA